MKYLTLWTIQRKNVWKKIFLDGRYSSNDPYIEDKEAFYNIPSFKKAYDWMIKNMEKKLGPRPVDCVLPIWAWYHYGSIVYPKPDLRTIVWEYEKGSEHVLIELVVPYYRAILSNFDAWNYVINNWYIPSSIRDNNKFNKIAKSLGVNPYIDKHPKQLTKIIEQSWNKVFDMDKLCEFISGEKDNRSIQATLWQIFKEDVVDTKFFVGRKRREGEPMACCKDHEKCKYCKDVEQNKLVTVQKPKVCCGKCKKQEPQQDNPNKDVDNGSPGSV